MRSCVVSLFLAHIFSHTVFAEAPELPSPPMGFEWKWCEEMHAAFLRPATWHVKQVTKEGTVGLFISKDDIDKNGEFKTGLTVNFVADIRKKTGAKPSAYAAATQKLAIKDQEKVMLVIPPVDGGRIKTVGFRLKKDDTITHSWYVADDGTDSLYVVFFESPADEWDSAWKTGEVIMKKLYFQFPEM
jgi:hypothetical protein